MKSTRAVRAVDFRFCVEAYDDQLVEYLGGVLSGFPDADGEIAHYRFRAPEGDDGPVRVSLDDAELFAHHDRPLALAWMLWHVNRQVVAQSSDRLLLHASCAATNGAAVVMPAPAESGKTTMVAGLLGAGLDYLTDECVPVDLETLTVEPYPKPLSVDPGSWPVLPHLAPDVATTPLHWLDQQWHVPPAAAGATVVTTSLPVAALIVPRYRAGATTTLMPVTPGTMAMVLTEQAFNFHELGAPGLSAIARLVRSVPCYEMIVGDLAAAVALVTDELEHLPTPLRHLTGSPA